MHFSPQPSYQPRVKGAARPAMSCQFGVTFTEPAKRTGGADKAPAEPIEAWNGRELLHVGAVDSSGVTKLCAQRYFVADVFR